MTSVATGRRAETVAAEFLALKGFTILERNWKTKYCEIDIVASKNQRMWFIEVKYRHNDNQGTGLDYITHQKLQRMHFGAEVWIHCHQWSGDYELAAVEVTGESFKITNFISCYQ